MSIVHPRACLGIATLAQRHTDYSFFTTFGLKGLLRHPDFTAGLIPCLRAEAEGERQRLAHHYPLSSASCVYFDTTHFLASPSFSWCRTFDGDSEASASIWANATLSRWTGSLLVRSLLCCIDGVSDSGHRQNVGHHWCAWIFLPVAVALAGCRGLLVFAHSLHLKYAAHQTLSLSFLLHVVKSQSAEQLATTEGESSRGGSSQGHKAGLLTVRVTSRHGAQLQGGFKCLASRAEEGKVPGTTDGRSDRLCVKGTEAESAAACPVTAHEKVRKVRESMRRCQLPEGSDERVPLGRATNSNTDGHRPKDQSIRYVFAVNIFL